MTESVKMKILAQKIASDKDLEREFYLHLKKQLDSEAAKPLNERNFIMIEQLSSDMAELFGTDKSTYTAGICKLRQFISEYEKSRRRFLHR